MKKIKIKYLNQKLCAAVLAGSITISLVGCGGQDKYEEVLINSKELSSADTNFDTINTNIDIIDTNIDIESSEGLIKGIKQVLPVEGEEFKLIIEYLCDDSNWCITSDKKLYMTIYTEGLPEDKNVYIDDIHMDTTIVSTNAYFDGILQDTLDDGVHSAVIIGFPISDNNEYFGVNVIEGQNSEFIQAYFYGRRSYYTGSVSEKRLLESDFLESGVWANKITGVIGLVIEDKNTGKIIRGVDIPTTLGVEINNKITYKKTYAEKDEKGTYKYYDKYVTYKYDKYGNKEMIEEEVTGKELVKKK